MNVTQGLRRMLQVDPQGIATVDGNRRHTWAELGDRVARLAGALQNLGIKAGDRVAVLMLNSDRYIELYLGVAWAGAVIVPTNIALERDRESRIRCATAAPSMLVVDKAFAAMGVQLAKAIAVDDAGLCRRRCAARRKRRTTRRCLRRPSRSDDAMRQAGRSRRHLLHRRHHRPLQGRDAEPQQSGHQRAEYAGRRPVPGGQRSISTPRRCSISPMARRCSRMLLSGGRNVVIRSFTPEGVMDAVQAEQVNDRA